uniref:Uncharacterized protein n=1 Tax=Cacopsylla melanoneura TaxID=428564 RepID=A0A8D9AJH8_9HEMI
MRITPGWHVPLLSAYHTSLAYSLAPCVSHQVGTFPCSVRITLAWHTPWLHAYHTRLARSWLSAYHTIILELGWSQDRSQVKKIGSIGCYSNVQWISPVIRDGLHENHYFEMLE